LRLKDKVSIITGAGKGIGKSTALLFAEEGSQVVICSRTKSDLDRVEEEISRKGGRCLSIVADISDRTNVDRLARRVLDQYKRVDILVNNAGIYPSRPLVDVSEQEWDNVIDTDLKSMFLCCKAVIPTMIAQRKGKIVNMSSVTGGVVGSATYVPYSAAKGGALGFSRSLALELAEYGINVNVVSPGTIVTPGIESLATVDRTLDLSGSDMPLKRLGDPMDVAYAVLFLASEESNYITGQMIVVDGGCVIVEHKQ